MVAVSSFWVIQDFPDTAKFLTDEERESRKTLSKITTVLMVKPGTFIIRRLQDDMKFSAAGETFKSSYIWKSIYDGKTWIASEFRF